MKHPRLAAPVLAGVLLLGGAAGCGDDGDVPPDDLEGVDVDGEVDPPVDPPPLEDEGE